MLITSCTWVLCHFITCTRIGNKRSIISCNLFWVVGVQGSQNLPPPIPCSPASRTFISHLPPFTVPLLCHDLRSPARLHFLQFDSLRDTCALLQLDILWPIWRNHCKQDYCAVSPEVSLFFSPSANFVCSLARLLGSLNSDWKDVTCKWNIIWVDVFESIVTHCKLKYLAFHISLCFPPS